MARASRAKGVAGEREARELLERYGFETVRLQNNVLDAGDFLAFANGVEYLVESKRRERLVVPVAYAQVAKAARNGQVPLVTHRRNREPLLTTLLAEDFARLLGGGS